jgi:hypothetical protein
MWQLLKRAEIPLRVGAIIAAAYLGYVFLARHTTNQRWADRQKSAQPAPDPKFEATYGGTAVKILQFYAREGAITEGESTVICYGVVNAKSVKIEPPVSGVQVALSNCVSAQPEHDTQYTLTAEGNDGKTVTAAFTLAVKPEPDSIPRITAFQVVKHSLELGHHYFTIAFRFQNARQVSIDPPVFSPLEDSAPFGQFVVVPEATTTYTLTVVGKKGRKATRKLTVEVPPKA